MNNPDMMSYAWQKFVEMMDSEAKWKQDGIIRKFTNMNGLWSEMEARRNYSEMHEYE